jgi:tetratricopeptide (TPR) repeat protein
MHVALVGNCQVQALGAILRKFVGPYVDLTLGFIDAYAKLDQESYQRLEIADAVVVQAGSAAQLLDAIPLAKHPRIYKVPIVSGAFIWPYQGVVHPLGHTVRYGNPPFTAEYNDRYLVKLVQENVPPMEALARYREVDVAAAAHVGRLYELQLEKQRALDAECGYDCAGIITEYLTKEQLFQSAFHFSGRIGRHLAATLCERMGFDSKYAERINRHLKEAPFVPRFVPVHPSIARHFGMTWVTEDTRYPFLHEGGFTFDEYVLRFMEARWSAALEEGVIDARQGKPEAREKLEQGLREAPGSAQGYHELSRLVEKDGDLAKALSLQQTAMRLGPTAAVLTRFGELLRKNGEHERAARVFRRATEADPVSLAAWIGLRDTLMGLGRMRKALVAAAQVVDLAPDPARAAKILARLRAGER